MTIIYLWLLLATSIIVREWNGDDETLMLVDASGVSISDWEIVIIHNIMQYKNQFPMINRHHYYDQYLYW